MSHTCWFVQNVRTLKNRDCLSTVISKMVYVSVILWFHFQISNLFSFKVNKSWDQSQWTKMYMALPT